MKGIRERKGKALAKRRASQGKPMSKPARCGIEDLVQYDAWYLGFSDRPSGWEGNHCIRLAASAEAHVRFFQGRTVDELRGRIGVVLEALGVIECDDASECQLALTTRVGTKPRRLKAMLRRCPCQGLNYLVFLLPEEEAPGVDWRQGR